MKVFYVIVFAAILSFFIPGVSAAHFIIGFANDAKNGAGADGLTVVLWNPSNGITDNVTDVIGVTGNSGVAHVYMIDCELLNTSCSIGDTVKIKVIDEVYTTNNVSVVVTGAGYDIAPNLTINSPPNISSISVEDFLAVPANEIDLNPASHRNVSCEAIIYEFDGESLQNASARLYDATNSDYIDSDDNNTHYTNNSCYIDSSYGGANDHQIFCNFQVMYYANPGNWECLLKVEDNLTSQNNDSDTTLINTLLSVGLPSLLDYGSADSLEVSDEFVLNATNYGNVALNLSLEGYASSINDGFAMNCTMSETNISVHYQKYNLTETNPGPLNLAEFETYYLNLTSYPAIKNFNLNYRSDDSSNNAVNSTYWRLYVPAGVAGNCSGNIIFGATTAQGS